MVQRIKILTWNIWNYNEWEARKPYLGKCIEDIDADIIALQEVRYNYLQGPNQAEELAANLEGYSMVVQPAAVETHHWEGLAILSKYPITQVNYWGLSRDPQDLADAPHQRIVLGAEVICGDLPLCLFNSHWSLSRPARVRTAREVLGFMGLFAGTNTRTLLMGDFNAEPYEEAIQIVKKNSLRLTDAWEEAHGDAHGGTWEVPRVEKRLDYIFHGKGLSLVSCERVGLEPNQAGVYPSDHTGILAVFQLGS
jgi:endonuclease/exonuclease/phosphatase family metal-dependent hydrolase